MPIRHQQYLFQAYPFALVKHSLSFQLDSLSMSRILHFPDYTLRGYALPRYFLIFTPLQTK
ncbi:MAG: hypothetical protein ACI88A_001364 [Paraglaciecola sp.]|jgi:hypothetical protein